MKEKKNNKIKSFCSKLTYTDKILLIFMSIIYTQIVYNLVTNEIANENTSPIDTIVRTTASSIFGYFLGSNLDKEDENEEEEKAEKVIEVKKTYKKNNTNTVIISILGVISLLIMLYLRNFTTLTYSSIASISQLKDFVSASVGYLVSKSNKNE